MDLEIIPFRKEYSSQFHDLNIEWLQTYFYVEELDLEVLSNPEEYIIDPGGHIFFVISENEILGTVALMPHKSGCLELTKMAVQPAARGKKIGQLLMQHCIDFAKDQGHTKLLLYSNTILENAIHIYRKFGFKEIPVEPDSPYDRSNIKMELTL
jgi:GNAT superfamily N-acetyltransferase